MSKWATNHGKPTFIQYKGTRLCMDFAYPECETSNHYDGDFMHFVRCGGCYAVFELSTGVDVRKLPPGAMTAVTPKDPVED